jgi:hypothetical protein
VKKKTPNFVSGSDIPMEEDSDEVLGSVRREVKPQYNITTSDVNSSKTIQELIHVHIQDVALAAKRVAGDILREQMEAVEIRVRENLKKIDKLKSTSLSIAGIYK